MDFSKIPVIILFLITVSVFGIYTTFNAFYIKRKNVNACDIYLVQVGMGISCAGALYAISGFKINISIYSLVLGIAFGTAQAFYFITNSFAIKTGPFGLTSVITNGATAITAFSGWLFFSESLTIFKILGIIFMLFCLMLASDKSEGQKKASFIWLIMCIISMVSSASIGLMQKIHQNSEYKNELMGFLVVAFVVKTLVSLVFYLSKVRVDKKKNIYVKSEMKINGLTYMLSFMITCGVCLAFNNCFNLYLSRVVDAAVLFPIVNGVPLMISLIVSVFVFKEKLIFKQVISFMCGLLAIVMFII